MTAVRPADEDAARPTDVELISEIERLIEEQRLSCLWFLRPDCQPRTDAQRIEVLEQIARHGDLDAFRRAATLKRWLSRTSSAAPAES